MEEVAEGDSRRVKQEKCSEDKIRGRLDNGKGL
jgi:hypothetical protein